MAESDSGVYYNVNVATKPDLGAHVVSIKRSRPRVDTKAKDKTVKFTATFHEGYELDYFTVGGKRISGDTYVVNETITVNAVAKEISANKKQKQTETQTTGKKEQTQTTGEKKQTQTTGEKKQTQENGKKEQTQKSRENGDMEKWKQKINEMVAKAEKDAKAKLAGLSEADRKKINDLEEKIRKASKYDFKTSKYGAKASKSSVSSSYSIVTAGLTGFSFSLLGAGFGVDGAYLAGIGMKTGLAGKSGSYSVWENCVALKSLAKAELVRQMGLKRIKTCGVSIEKIMSEYKQVRQSIHI